MNSSEQTQYSQIYLDQSKVPSLVAGFTVSLVLAYLGVAARLLSRYLIRTKLQAEDYLILLALLFTTGFIIPNCVFIAIYNFGRHEELVSNPVALTKGIQAAEILYTAGIFFFKASICRLLYRIFPVRWFRRSQIAIMGFVFAYSVTQIVCILTTCTPLAAIWNPNIHASCIDIDDVYIVISSFNIFTDAVILVLPLPIVWALHTSTSRKIQLSIMFSLGALVFVASIVRITQLSKVSLTDPSYSDNTPVIWSSLEMAFGTLGASTPTYSPLIMYITGNRAGLEAHRTGYVPKHVPSENVRTTNSVFSPTSHRVKHPFEELERSQDFEFDELPGRVRRRIDSVS